MRAIYLDESGISVNDSLALVAGVIINDDEQWKSVEKAIHELIEEYVPEEHRDGFSFHATHLYHCSGKIFHHTKYPRERARQALKDLLAIPRRFRLPVSVGYISKPETVIKPAYGPREAAMFFHGFAYFMCVMSAEIYLVDDCGPNDLARLFAENNTDTRNVIKMAHQTLRGQRRDPNLDGILEKLPFMEKYLPLRRIVETVHFVDKDEAMFLQLADACAFLFRLWAEQKSGEYVDEYFHAFHGEGRAFPALDVSPVFQGTWTFPEPPVAA